MDGHKASQAIVIDADAPMSRFASELPNELPLSESELRRPVRYRGYKELLKSWAALPNARTQLIGRSRQGEPLWMVEIGNPKASRVSAVIAGIHPIEWIGMESAFQIAQAQAENPCTDRRVCFFPLANPDGFRKVEGNLRAGKRGWVRANDAGVDLNRNWPTHFKKSRGLIAGHNCSGPEPLSEPEVAAIVQTLDAINERARIDVALSLHSIGKMILIPWGGIWKAPEAKAKHLQVATVLKQGLGKYTIRQVSHWVPGVSFAHGMEIDHLHQAYGSTAILIECTRGEVCWYKPQVFLDPFRIFNPQDGREQAAHIATALESFVRGQL